MEFLDRAVTEQALSYPAYRALIDRLLEAGKTTGTNHSPAYQEYTRLNIARMKRLDRTTRLLPEVEEALKAMPKPQTWLVITEGWCGDAAQIVPVLNAMAEASDRVTLRLLLRDEHPEIMDAFLTRGARSIPKVVLIDDSTRRVLGSWGPRPQEAQAMALARTPARELQRWYARDKTRSFQREFAGILRSERVRRAAA